MRGDCSVSYLSLAMVALEESVGELNGGENSLHWQANMLPLFSSMTLWLKLVSYLLLLLIIIFFS